MKTEFEQEGSHPRPGLIGRMIRMAAGVMILYLTIPGVIFHYDEVIRTGWEIAILGWIPGFLISVYLLPVIIDRGFGVHWGRRSQAVFGLVFLAFLAIDLLVYGNPWAPPLGLLVVLTIAVVLGFLGLSFLVAGLFATPG